MGPVKVNRSLGVLGILTGASVLAVAARVALADGSGLCVVTAFAAPKNPVAVGAPLPTDPEDWEPGDPNDHVNWGIDCATDSCSQGCIESIVAHLGFDANTGWHTFMKGCDCPGEGGVFPGQVGADPTGGDGQTDCTLGAVYEYNEGAVVYRFVRYVCAGSCDGGQTCRVETGSTLESGGQIIAAEITCECG